MLNVLLFSLMLTLFLMKTYNVICVFVPLGKMLSPDFAGVTIVYVVTYKENSVSNISKNFLSLTFFLFILSL